mmetsp:Transcript_21040/g.24034  ORF Transcript_21040/g.24034 Transcript_21040/m.24034 type:complete len:87 (-) Transcript_21040:27-287(-)
MASATNVCDAAAKESQIKLHNNHICMAIWCAANASPPIEEDRAAMAVAPERNNCNIMVRNTTELDAITNGRTSSFQDGIVVKEGLI